MNELEKVVERVIEAAKRFEVIFISYAKLPKDKCWEWKGSRDSQGYGRVYMGVKYIMAHRVSYSIFKGKVPRNLSVLHHCDNPCCINPDHLFLGTQADNNRDRAQKGRNGYTGPVPSFDKDQIFLIRELEKSGINTRKELSIMYKTTPATITRIVNKPYRLADGSII